MSNFPSVSLTVFVRRLARQKVKKTEEWKHGAKSGRYFDENGQVTY